MKIKINYIKQIIKEEIQNTLYSDAIKRKVINLFIKGIQLADDPANKENIVQDLIKSFEEIGVNPSLAINMLDPDREVDQNFYIRCAQLHNEIVKIIGGEEKNINAFAHFPQIDHNPNIDQDAEFLRSPQTKSSRKGEPVYLYKKNWVQE